ncbi:hypothetical protein D3C75_457440 [compost metagenome]
MSKYEVAEFTSSHSSAQALNLALEYAMDSEIGFQGVETCKGSRWHYPDLGPDYLEHYNYYKATISFIPGEKFIQERIRKQEEAKKLEEERRRRKEEETLLLELDWKERQERIRVKKENRKKVFKKIFTFWKK